MGDVLSQAEIDALLSAISSGDVESTTATEGGTTRVMEYDFRTANRFNKEHMRTLRIIYETFARLFASYLSGTLRAMCSAEVVSVEELKYHEFTNALPSPVILAVVRMPPLTGSILLEISPDLCYAMISKLLGGQADKDNIIRSFTEIELVLLERIMRQILPLFGESWEKVVAVSSILDRLETSPSFAQIVALNETVAIITINVKLDEAEGLFNICLPHLSLEPVNQQLSTKLMYQTNDLREVESAYSTIQARIENTSLDLSVVFNDTTASVRDILNLQVGDVITLDHFASQPLTVNVGHLPKFKGEVGMKETHYAVKISEIIMKEGAGDE